MSRKQLVLAFCRSQLQSWVCLLLSASQLFDMSRVLDLSDLSESSLYPTSLVPWAL